MKKNLTNSNESLKNELSINICNSNETRALLNQDINLEYSYLIKEPSKNYFVSFTKVDC